MPYCIRKPGKMQSCVSIRLLIGCRDLLKSVITCPYPQLSDLIRVPNTYFKTYSHCYKRNPTHSHSCKANELFEFMKIKGLHFGMTDALYRARALKGGQHYEEQNDHTSAYLGAGAGVVLFAIFGLLPGSILGGAAGLRGGGNALRSSGRTDPCSARPSCSWRLLAGVMVAGLVIVTACSIIGWVAGRLIESAGHH